MMFWLYRRTLGPALHFLSIALIGPGSGCRFNPTCSQYARDAIVEHGWIKGARLAIYRLASCQPWTKLSEASHGS